MIERAVIINDSRDESLRILDAIISDRRVGVEISPTELAKQIGVTESTVRYNVRKFVKLGYLRPVGRTYEPTKKIVFLKKND
jgi:DNA-binding IclR family transcriptional regulator